jgi:uncharacterized damage-inducible protein DinB
MNASSQPTLNRSEQKDELEMRLLSSRDRFLAAVAGIPDDLSRICPADDNWSVLECAEHVAVAERGMFSALEKRQATDAAPDKSKDALIQAFALNRTQKLPAPERAHPKGRFSSLGEALDDFRFARERTLAYLQDINEDLRTSIAVHPSGTFDSYQLVLIMALHAERHALQVEEIQNSLAYRNAAEEKRANHP